MLDGIRVESVLGVGGMGVVYKAVQTRLERPVAIKVLPASSARPDLVEKFEAEARAMARLQHPNIVTIYDFGDAEGNFFIVMELVGGTTLHHAIHGGGVDTARALSVLGQVCEAVEFAHGQGTVHRDIKAENVLLGEDGVVKVTDFGLARLLATGLFERNVEKGVVHATPGYAAPEISVKGASVDHRADIYALGALFYEMLAKSPPPAAGEWVPPSRVSDTNPMYDAVILHAMRRDPAERYQSAAAFWAAVSQAGQSGSVRPAAKASRSAAPVRPASGGGPKPVPVSAAQRRMRARVAMSRRSGGSGAMLWWLAIGFLLVAGILVWKLSTGGSGREADPSRSGGSDDLETLMGFGDETSGGKQGPDG